MSTQNIQQYRKNFQKATDPLEKQYFQASIEDTERNLEKLTAGDPRSFR